jgi:hypothetical protein
LAEYATIKSSDVKGLLILTNLERGIIDYVALIVSSLPLLNIFKKRYNLATEAHDENR